MRKVTKSQIRAALRKGNAEATLTVFLCGNKLYPNPGYGTFTVKLFWCPTEGQVCVCNQSVFAQQSDGQYREVPRTFEALLDNWSYYNSCYETGYTPAFYVK